MEYTSVIVFRCNRRSGLQFSPDIYFAAFCAPAVFAFMPFAS